MKLSVTQKYNIFFNNNMTHRILFSCFKDGESNEIPLGLDWANTLIKLFPKKYKITVLLHGKCIKYSMQNSKYKKLLRKMHKKGIHFKVCEYCLIKDGYNIKNLINFIKPIKFSIDYIAKYQSKCIPVIFD